jgi:hypothetical protein
MSAADEAYARLMAAQQAYDDLIPEQKRHYEEEMQRQSQRDARTRLIKRKLGKVY